MAKITVDFDKEIGKIKPLHGIGQPPMVRVNQRVDTTAFRLLKDAGIPYSRLHDVGGAYGNNRFVDIPTIFRDFSKDPYDEKSYHFAFTDILIKDLMENDCEPVFRLGVTIENQSMIEAFNIYPPEDFKKWAIVCEHIIKHYTQGWANGFNYDIKYWEIWNEPDNHDDIKQNQMWLGTKEQYFELYDVASKHLKEKFPHLKIGGYGSCGFYMVVPDVKEGLNPAAHGRYSYFIEFFEDFMKFAKENKCPLDFFSFHAYGAEKGIPEYSSYCRKALDDAGYKDTEMHLNEWNAGAEFFATGKQTAIVMKVLVEMQHSAIDAAMIYDGRFGMGAGVYAPIFGDKTKNGSPDLGDRISPLPLYYGFMAYNELYKRQNEVFATCDDQNLCVIAAKGEDGAILIANPTDNYVDLEFDCNLPLGEFFITEDELKMSYCPRRTKIQPNALLLIKTK